MAHTEVVKWIWNVNFVDNVDVDYWDIMKIVNHGTKYFIVELSVEIL